MYNGFSVRLIVRLYVVLFTKHLKVAGYTSMTITRKDFLIYTSQVRLLQN